MAESKDTTKADDKPDEKAPVKKAAAEAPKVRTPPPVKVPSASNRSSGGPSNRVRELQVALADLGFYVGRVDGFYTSPVRNAVSALQQKLSADGFYDGIPHGKFDDATRAALLASDLNVTA